NPKVISLELEKQVENITEKIINGEIIIPTNEMDYDIFLTSLP
ncbi:BMP family ABC transporter substrate-binding protein, partial (plasmid) [Candidatus Borreliella tachyglossi]